MEQIASQEGKYTMSTIFIIEYIYVILLYVILLKIVKTFKIKIIVIHNKPMHIPISLLQMLN